MFKRKRYFLVSYTALTVGGGYPVNGSSNIEVTNGFPKRCEVIEFIETGINSPIKDIVINSLMEISKKDYKRWISE
jgi:hypothetical protein